LNEYFYRLSRFSSETVSRLRPLALLLAKTRLPFAVAMRDLNPCLLTRFLFEGWYVLLLIVLSFLGVQK